jgi:hypothetical protein
MRQNSRILYRNAQNAGSNLPHFHESGLHYDRKELPAFFRIAAGWDAVQ